MSSQPPASSAPAAAQPESGASPWGDGPSPKEQERSWDRRQLVGRLAMLVLVGAAAVVVLTAIPVVVRMVLVQRADPARRGIAREMWSRGWAVGPPEPEKASAYAPRPSDYSSERGRAGLELLERLLGDPEGGEAGEDDEPSAHRDLAAVARRDLVLLERAEPGADVVLEIPRGQTMLVVKDSGRWLLLAVRQPGRVTLGWTTREQVALIR